MKHKPTLHIVGQGAIGLLLAYYLHSKFDVCLLLRNKHLATKKQPCTYLHSGASTRFTVKTESIHCVEQVQNVLIPTKSYQVSGVLDSLSGKLSNNANIIFSHNGMPNLDDIENRISTDKNLYFLTTSMGALKQKSFTLCHTGFGASFFGVLHQGNNKTSSLINALSKSIPNCHIESNINTLLWRKLLINVAINPLSAVHQVKNGELVSPIYANDIIGLLNEAVYLAKREGIKVTLVEALTNAYQVMHATKDNNSSMNRDFFFQRQTEINSICGFIAKKGVQYHYPTPYNSRFLALIQGDIL